ncbi:MAG: glutathione S-transferase family protein [Myxococcota bacterium]
MAVELWWGSGSTPAWRVQLGFAVKGVPYEGHQISFSDRDTRKPEYLEIHPRGKVPGIRDGGYTLNESLAILAWLDKKHPEPALFGHTAEDTGQVWRWCLEYENHGSPTFGAVARPIAFGRAEAEAEAVRAAIPAVHDELARFASAVDGGRWLVGGAVSAADLVWYTGIAFLVRAATRPAAAAFDLGVAPFAERWPAILSWGRKVEALPGFDATIPPHWLTGESPYPARWR